VSEKERYLSLAEIIEERQFTDIINTVLERLLELRREDEEDKRIALECERMYEEYENDPEDSGAISFDDMMKELGLSEEDLKNA